MTWFLGTSIGRWVLGAVAAVVIVGAVILRAYYGGKSAAKGEAASTALNNIAKGLRARAKEQVEPTDENTDPYNRDRHGNSGSGRMLR